MLEIEKHPRFEEARRRARDLRGFYVHALTYAVVISGLAALNLLNHSGRWWFLWPAMGWGIGVAAHGLSVFGFRGWLGADWEERKIREYLDRRP